MSTDAEAPATTLAEPENWPILGPRERRVLGVLIEKAKTTPDNYPLTLNALVNGCNQKNNREPVMSLIDADVEEALAGLKKAGYVQQIMGSGRTDKFRHVAYEGWKVDKVQLAILAELLLRGAQTEGELRGRASRMEPIDDLEQLRSHCRQLADRRLVVYLTPEGRRGTMLTHGFHSPDELERLKSRAFVEGEESPAAARRSDVPAPPPEWQTRLQTLEADVGRLRAEMDELRKRVDATVP